MISTVALSLCTSQMLSNSFTSSPARTNHCIISTSAMPSPMSASTNGTVLAGAGPLAWELRREGALPRAAHASAGGARAAARRAELWCTKARKASGRRTRGSISGARVRGASDGAADPRRAEGWADPRGTIHRSLGLGQWQRGTDGRGLHLRTAWRHSAIEMSCVFSIGPCSVLLCAHPMRIFNAVRSFRPIPRTSPTRRPRAARSAEFAPARARRAFLAAATVRRGASKPTGSR